MTPETDLAAIAGKLSRGQRAAVLSAKVHAFGNYPDRWVCPDAGRVAKRLGQLGLTYLAFPLMAWRSDRRDVCLTPLGLRLRAFLQGQDQS